MASRGSKGTNKGNQHPSVTPEKIAQMKALHATGAGRNEIARQMGISPSTVSVHMPKGSFDCTATKVATEVRKTDLAARKVRLAERQMRIAELIQKEKLRGLKGKGYQKLVKIPMGGEEVQNLDFIPSGDLQQLGNSLSSSVTIIDRLTRDRDTENLPAVDAWLAALTGGEAPDGG